MSSGNPKAVAGLYQGVIRDSVHPVLREVGFTRKGNAFRRHRAEVVHVIVPQKSVKSSAQEILFTVNLGVASIRLLNRSWRQPPSFAIEDCHWRERLGPLARSGKDVWWTIRDEKSADAAAREVVEWLRSFGVPALDALPDDAALRGLWRSGRCPGLTEVQRLRYLGEIEESP